MNHHAALLATLIAIASATAAAAGRDDMKPYPPADPGSVRMVFRVPPIASEGDHKVEILVGRILDVDCNQTWFIGDLDQRIVEGWGFPYYVLESVGGPATTMMACPPDSEKAEAYVKVRGNGFLERYNSKLPMVVYVPDGFQVRYRIWSAEEEMLSAAPE